MTQMITRNFSISEMACLCGCGLYEMDEEFMRMLQELRNQMQGPLRVSSGRRCDAHNWRVSTALNKQNSIHTKVQAADILVSGESAMLLFKKARKLASMAYGGGLTDLILLCLVFWFGFLVWFSVQFLPFHSQTPPW
jgi:uncharacterized protein YcbK (DUF882 family)